MIYDIFCCYWKVADTHDARKQIFDLAGGTEQAGRRPSVALREEALHLRGICHARKRRLFGKQVFYVVAYRNKDAHKWTS